MIPQSAVTNQPITTQPITTRMKLPKSESLIILVFIGCVALWGISKCSAVRSDAVRRVRDLTDGDAEDRPVRRDTVVLTQPAASPAASAPVSTERPGPAPVPHSAPPTGNATTTPTARPGKTPASAPAPAGKPAATSAAPPTGDAPKYATLYVTIDGLKLRKEPNLKGAVVATLELYEPVSFLNKKSEKAEEISLGYEKVTDHWVKVRTKSGKDGWVFGAGVHYYKMKRKGVLE